MNLIFIGALIGAIIGYFYGYKHYADNKTIGLKALGGFLIGVVVSGILSLILSLIVKHDRVPVEYDRVDIRAMSDGNQLSGSFFLGSGTVDNRSYYYYYEVLESGAFKQGKINVDRAVIFEDSTLTDGYMVLCDMRLPEGHWSRGWAILGDVSCSCDGPAFIEFHVPNGSVKHNYNMDLE